MPTPIKSRFARPLREILAGVPAIKTFSKQSKPLRQKCGAPAMAIKFGGNFEVTRSPEEVYDFLTDPTKFAPLLPDFQGMDIQDERHFAVKVNVGVSYIRSEEHTSELQSLRHLVCRLLLENKNKIKIISVTFRRVIRTNHKKASKIWRHEHIQLGGCQS